MSGNLGRHRLLLVLGGLQPALQLLAQAKGQRLSDAQSPNLSGLGAIDSSEDPAVKEAITASMMTCLSPGAQSSPLSKLHSCYDVVFRCLKSRRPADPIGCLSPLPPFLPSLFPFPPFIAFLSSPQFAEATDLCWLERRGNAGTDWSLQARCLRAEPCRAIYARCEGHPGGGGAFQG